MQRMREFWNAFRNFAIFFSFIMNFVVMLVLLFVVMLIFDIKNGIAEPLIDGLHANFVGLNNANIRTTVNVDDEIPIDFDLTVADTTVVTLTQDVAINGVPAYFVIAGGGGDITGTVDIVLPAGTPLTIDLSLLVPVQQTIPISLPVEVDIALSDTELAVPFTNLRNLFEPYVKALDNLPSGWGEVRSFTFDAIDGEVDLTASTDCSENPWPIGTCDNNREVEVDNDTDTTNDGQTSNGGSSNGTNQTPPPTTAPNTTPDNTAPSSNATPTITPFPASQ